MWRWEWCLRTERKPSDGFVLYAGRGRLGRLQFSAGRRDPAPKGAAPKTSFAQISWRHKELLLFNLVNNPLEAYINVTSTLLLERVHSNY